MWTAETLYKRLSEELELLVCGVMCYETAGRFIFMILFEDDVEARSEQNKKIIRKVMKESSDGVGSNVWMLTRGRNAFDEESKHNVLFFRLKNEGGYAGKVDLRSFVD
jgi:hypothetical protein